MNDPAEHQPPLPASPAGSDAPVWRSKELLKGSREILISHDDETYRLRLTRNGKLILTK
ncbi:hemin uptake protein HemP [Lacibacterium aquatile]|uniref:Hemin uptake protein HemP n=1 Tax=Lacibacterium aquatile TaxID=1168082 RepID=A0ABW5DKU5_9PROT